MDEPFKALKLGAAKGKNRLAMKKVRPEKVVRDSFTMPKADYELIDTLKKRCIGLGTAVKKTELLRAGLAALSGLPSESLVRAIDRLDPVKTGRPPSQKKKRKKENTPRRRPGGGGDHR